MEIIIPPSSVSRSSVSRAPTMLRTASNASANSYAVSDTSGDTSPSSPTPQASLSLAPRSRRNTASTIESTKSKRGFRQSITGLFQHLGESSSAAEGDGLSNGPARSPMVGAEGMSRSSTQSTLNEPTPEYLRLAGANIGAAAERSQPVKKLVVSSAGARGSSMSRTSKMGDDGLEALSGAAELGIQITAAPQAAGIMTR
jgi:hypothetical protein